ncbi:FKBP-type peptidyl-prolyl cis-trans isomerase [Cesiribacter andamanensis]|uniref:Peptidyl-prolyl cis-trans isomerase n=1 Tax=Cesiribacter andamanensis AMV16 TaxID=1279009 RepID=M7N0U8_9BACT|nr:FKBP-type peptidyl-prolyl cis-trans isomerase [Cesiribacter andamanensis]EMR00826.1 Outer membrane protein MIP precursor [Cesiribacter andamanensis AMV16]
MKFLSFLLCLSLLSVSPVLAQSKKELKAQVQRLTTELTELKKPKEADLSQEHSRVSYAIGVMIATNMQQQPFDSLDVEALSLAFRDVLNGGEVQLQPQEAETIIQTYMQQVMEARSAQAREEARAFLEQNRTKEGVVQTASGLQYKVIKAGSGKTPGPNDRVTVHYTGMLTDGTVFDSSLERGEPVTFGVSQIIPGWTEALQLMKEGAKWTLFIPAELAYGERGAGNDIPPYATLIFEVELLKVE